MRTSRARARARVRQSLAIAAAGILVALVAPLASAEPGGNDRAGFRTDQAAMLDPVRAGVSAEPLITVGETLAGGYRFESIPDGIALRNKGSGRIDVLVNHETSTVPFPYTPSAPTPANSQNDFDNAQVSQLTFNRHSGGIVHAAMAISSDENFQRFCSNYLATSAESFDREILFTNEEAVDWVNRSGQAWPATIGADEARQAGLVVAHDVRTGQTRPIWGMGRHNHENSVPVPGYGYPVVLSGDDTFTNNPSQSQLYSYVADDADAVWNDEGELYAFVSDDPTRQKYEDFVPGDPTVVSGHFMHVPRLIATGVEPDGTELLSSEVPASLGGPFPAPPNDGTWQRDPNGVGIDGPQWVLDYWSRTNGVFGFVRVEDIAYDKRAGMENVVYVVDSGRGTAGAPQPGRSTNGRVWRLVLDPDDPTAVEAMSILIDGDTLPVKDPNAIHQPDNIESTAAALYFTEDPGSSQQFNPGESNATTARIWAYALASGQMDVVFRVNQSADGGATDVDELPNGRLGAWESSGIVDASASFGPGTFLVNVQAHTLWVDRAEGDDNVPPAGPDFTYKREGGQLLLVRIPGG
jgi:hypothetical protein